MMIPSMSSSFSLPCLFLCFFGVGCLNLCHGFLCNRNPSTSSAISFSRSSILFDSERRCRDQHPPMLYVSKINSPPSSKVAVDDNDDDDKEDFMSDEMILESTPKSQLEDLCSQLGLPTKGSKSELLKSLRDFADEQSELERKRQLERKVRVEEGTGNDKERYEILDDGDDDYDDEEEGGFLFIHLPEKEETNKKVAEHSEAAISPGSALESQKASPDTGKWKPSLPRDAITAPPMHLIEPNEKGERVFTVYSTTDQNDLTGIAASQPGQAAASDPMVSGSASPSGNDAPWDTSQLQKGKVTEAQMDVIKDELIELVQSLLAMTGAPAFQDEFDDASQQLEAGGVFRRRSYSSPEGFTGFDPTKVPTDMLTKASKALRASRGRILKEVLREFELRAVGYDGTAGDDVERGGGHYKEVSKVGAFLEGVRRAEVNKIARETVTILLGKMMTEGIDGIDLTLSSMVRGGSDTSDDAGELNDALLDYLNDVVRQQEKKVEQMNIKAHESRISAVEVHEDVIEKLWRVDEEDGERIETFDMNDPKTRSALRSEYEKAEQELQRPAIPASVPEKLLLLLKLLRDRVKTEAVFAHDEKARNLRVLAYCLHASSEEERIQILEKELGSSFDVSCIGFISQQ